MKRMLSILFIALVLSIATSAVVEKFTLAEERSKAKCIVTLINDTEQRYTFWLLWLDHPWLREMYGRPTIKICAEIEPHKVFRSTYSTSPGLYRIEIRKTRSSNAERLVEGFNITNETEITITITIEDGRERIRINRY